MQQYVVVAATVGGVGSPLVGNSIRGVSQYNIFGQIYHQVANVAFGQIAPYTGF